MSGGRRRGKARDRVRARVEARRGAESCPYPDKPGYDLSAPDEARLAAQRGGPGLRLVECTCGYWHYVQTDGPPPNAPVSS